MIDDNETTSEILSDGEGIKEEEDKPVINKRKAQINANVSIYMKRRCMAIVNDPESGLPSISDLVSEAISEYLARYDLIQEELKKTEEDKFKDMVRQVLLEIKEFEKENGVLPSSQELEKRK